MTRRLALVPEQGNRTVLYVRVSALMGRDGETFHSPDMQMRAMRDLVGRRGLVEVAVVEDLDVSGRTFERAGLQRVLEMARAREVDVVALYDLSRLGRNTSESLRTIAELRSQGVTVVSTVEQIDDTPEGQFQLGVFLGMAQLYSDQVSRKWSQVIEHRTSQGKMHGVIPAGYRRREDGEVEVDPLTAPAVIEVFQCHAAGERLASIRERFRASTGRRATYPSLKWMLRNPAYVGKVRVNGEIHPGRHEALVSDALWAKAQRRLEADARTPSRRLAVANSLAGIAVCSECTGALARHMDSARGRVVLECWRANHHHDCGGCGRPRLDLVEDKVIEDLQVYARGLLDLAAQAARRAGRTRAKADATRVARELRKTQGDLARAGVQHSRGDTSVEEFRAVADLLRAEIVTLKAELADSERVAQSPSPQGVMRLTEALVKRWPRMTAEERNRALKPLVAKVEVRASLFWREPVEDRVLTLFV